MFILAIFLRWFGLLWYWIFLIWLLCTNRFRKIRNPSFGELIHCQTHLCVCLAQVTGLIVLVYSNKFMGREIKKMSFVFLEHVYFFCLWGFVHIHFTVLVITTKDKAQSIANTPFLSHVKDSPAYTDIQTKMCEVCTHINIPTSVHTSL